MAGNNFGCIYSISGLAVCEQCCQNNSCQLLFAMDCSTFGSLMPSPSGHTGKKHKSWKEMMDSVRNCREGIFSSLVLIVTTKMKKGGKCLLCNSEVSPSLLSRTQHITISALVYIHVYIYTYITISALIQHLEILVGS